MLSPWKKSNDKPRQCIKKQRHYFAYKGPYSQSYGFSSSHVWMWELDNKKGWALKNLCLWTVELGKTLETPLDRKEIKPVNPKGNQHRIFIGRTNAETEAPIFWPSDVKSQLIGKDPDAERDWKQEETGSTEDEMVGWHYWLNGHEFEQTPGDSKGQEAWRAAVYGVAKSQTWLSDWTTTTYVFGEKKNPSILTFAFFDHNWKRASQIADNGKPSLSCFVQWISTIFYGIKFMVWGLISLGLEK